MVALYTKGEGEYIIKYYFRTSYRCARVGRVNHHDTDQ